MKTFRLLLRFASTAIRLRRSLTLAMLVTAIAVLPASRALAQGSSILHNFSNLNDRSGNVEGISPVGRLLLANGVFYGTASRGGNSDLGTAYKVNADGTGVTVLHHFAGSGDGSEPNGGLVLVGGTLYGTTTTGGAGGSGTVFKVNPDGTGYAVQHSFSFATNGGRPNGTLVVSGSTLYGVAYQGGGTDTYGTVFKINTNGSGFAVLKSFAVDSGTGALPSGANPTGGLVLSGTTLYGAASGGGATGDGVLFKIETNGSGFAVVQNFTGSAGQYPNGDLVLSAGTLYGTTNEGGASDLGTIFKVGVNGTGFTLLRSFAANPDASRPEGGLVLVGSTLYGTGSDRGQFGGGALFKIGTDGSGYALLHSFARGNEGGTPRATLIATGTTLYGVAADYGAGGSGTLFQMNTDGSGFGVVHAFSATFLANNLDGAYPSSGLVSADGSLYGIGYGGGGDGQGVVFKVERDGSGFIVLRSFTGGLDGGRPGGRLALIGDTLYGTTSAGGSNGNGTLFKIKTDGSGFAVLRSFSNSEGVTPGDLIVSGTVLYGILRDDGVGGSGSVYRINTDGTGFTVLRYFARDANGATPTGRLTLAGTVLYGATRAGGTGDAGVIYQINTDGTGFTVLRRFTGSDGSAPSGGLVLSGAALYGMTGSGGLSGAGTLFKINTNGAGFATLRHFTAAAEGQYPVGALTLVGQTLQGFTESGGTGGQGTLFRIELDGSGFSVVQHFQYGIEGAPRGDPLATVSGVFGTSGSGGALGNGTVFKVASAVSAGIVVTTAADVVNAGDGQTSLREAVNLANSLGGLQNIVFSDGSAGTTNFATAPQTIDLASELPAFTAQTAIIGPGAGRLTIRRPAAAAAFRLLRVNSGANARLSDLTLTGGKTASGANGGGAILNAGLLSLTRVTISGNATDAADTLGGGGILNTGTLTATLTTFHANSSAVAGGAIRNAGTLTLHNSTLTGNSSGVFTSTATVTLANALCVGNGDNISGSFTNGGGNLTTGTAAAAGLEVDGGGNPILKHNGGSTFTVALAAGSAAIDAGDANFNSNAFDPPLIADQRGFARVQKGNAASPAARVDIGAYELLAVPTLTAPGLTVITGGAAINLATAPGASPGGGTFSGPGVTNGIFDPTGLALDHYVLTYTVSDGFGATNSVTFTVTVAEVPSLVVNLTTDLVNATDAQTSLREAVAYARSLSGTVTFDPAVFGTAQTITLTNGRLLLGNTESITIRGPGADRLTLAGQVAGPAFSVEGSANLTLIGMKLTGFASPDAGGAVYVDDFAAASLASMVLSGNSSTSGGGAIQNHGTCEVTQCTISGNTGRAGGGIRNSGGTLTVTNSTIAGNTAIDLGFGGGIYNTGTAFLKNSTVAGNSVAVGLPDRSGGGVATFGTFVARNSIIAGNSANQPDFFGTFTSQGFNLIGSTTGTTITGDTTGNLLDVDPKLVPLASNGGAFQTVALQPGSPALDAGADFAALNAAVTSAETSLTVADASGFPGGVSVLLQINAEQMLVTARSGNTLTVVRGANGSTAAAHSAGAGVNPAFDGRGAGFARKLKWKANAASARVDIGAFEGSPTPTFANSAITVTANAPSDLAALTGPSPAGGTFSGTGVNSATGLFDPSGRTLGDYTLTYSVNDGFGGANSATFTLTLLEMPALAVSTTTDTVNPLDGQTSLREALVYAHSLGGPQTITFAPSVAGQTVTLSAGWNNAGDSPALRVAGQITVQGPTTAPGVTLAIAAGVAKRHFYVEPSGALILANLTLTGGNVSDFGGAIWSAGTLTVRACTLNGNSAGVQGGAIQSNVGTVLVVENSTISGNTSGNVASAIATGAAPNTFRSVTITNNTGPTGTLYLYDTPTTMVNSIVAGNSNDAIDTFGSGAFNAQSTNNILGSTTSAGLVNGTNGNFTGVTATQLQLGTLGNLGGPTRTVPLLPGSLAINRGVAIAGQTTDQRGNLRPQFGIVDIGAFEQTPFDTGQTIVTAGGAAWYLGPDAIGNDLRIYREVTGEIPVEVGGAATRIGLATDGTVLVENANGGVYARVGSTTGIGSGYQLLTSATAADGATWFLGPDGFGSDFYIYRWAAGGLPTYSSGASTQLVATPDGFLLARNAGGGSYLRIGSNAGLGSEWRFLTESLVVTTVADENNGTSEATIGAGTSLREAVAYANALGTAQTITFAPTLAGQTVVLRDPSGNANAYEIGTALFASGQITIQGPSTGPGVTLQIDPAVERRHFLVGGGASLTLVNLTLRGGKALIPFHSYGGSVWSFGSLTVRGSTFTGNQSAGEGGAVQCWGESPLFAVENSTFSGNTSGGTGGAINAGSLQMSLRHVTLTNNTATNGFALELYKYPATLVNCLIAGNPNDGIGLANGASVSAQSTHNLIGPGGSGGLVDGVNGNRVGVPAGQLSLGPLADHGGPTPTVALLPGSPAVDAGIALAGLATDPRGVARPQGAAVDIGAFELVPSVAAATPVVGPLGGAYESSVQVTISNGAPGATVRYTLDGSAPTASNGAIYAGPFTLTNSATVRAIAVGGGWLPSPVASVSYTILSPLPWWRALHGLPADGSQDLGNPSGDGVANLLKFAFNMAPNPGDLAVPNIGVLPKNGTAGLPFSDRDAQGRLVIEFIRRKAATNPGIGYVVETGDNLAAGLQPLDLTGALVESIDLKWERVTVTDPTITPQRFGRVRVWNLP